MILLLPAAAQTPPAAGVVLDNEGNWELNGSVLHPGDSIPLGAEIRPAQRVGPMSIWYKSGRVVVPPCMVPCKPKPPEKQSAGGAFFSAAVSLFQQDQKRYALAVSRSLERDPQESVIALSGPQVDLAPVFTNLPAGAYSVNGASVSWTPRGTAMVPSAPFKTGIATLKIIRQGGDPKGVDVWVLFTTPAKYPQQSAAFKEALETAADWGDDVDSSTSRALLRAYLTALAR